MTSKGQVTIPKDLRDRFGLKEGEEVLMVPANEGILLKHRMDSMRSLRGLMREEVVLQKASSVIGKLRREWRVAGDLEVHNRHRRCPRSYRRPTSIQRPI